MHGLLRPTIAILASLAALMRRRRRSSASCRRPSTAVGAGDAHRLDRRNPMTGTSKRMSCFGFATLMMQTPGAGQMPGAANHLVGALHGFDRDDRRCFTAIVWPMSSAAIGSAIRYPKRGPFCSSSVGARRVSTPRRRAAARAAPLSPAARCRSRAARRRSRR